MKKKFNILFFISDEGFGHTVRQRAIIKEFLKNKEVKSITVYTSKTLKILKEEFSNKIKYKSVFNNISTKKNQLGHLKIRETINQFNAWEKKSKIWLKERLKEKIKADFIISDFVPEAFELADILRIKSYGVCHFTWDWLYEKILTRKRKLNLMESYIKKAEKIFFPPITEKEILEKYKKKSHKINFIITEFKKKKIINSKMVGIIMDNGTKSNSRNILKILPYLNKLNNVKFYVQADNFIKNSNIYKIVKDTKNIKLVYGNKNIHSKLPISNFVIARGGFNTISECLVLKKPSLLIEEPRNPEIKKNLNYVFRKKYSVPLFTKDLSKNIIKRLNKFLLKEYYPLKKRLNGIEFNSNGAKQVYNEIIKDIKNDKNYC
tara:strand:+ start:587 stop:1717 length:1131 start_codon:yes stop_codon:yes gene_type:complete